MSPDGKPIQVNASALQAAAAQNAVGKLYIVIGLTTYKNIEFTPQLSSVLKEEIYTYDHNGVILLA